MLSLFFSKISSFGLFFLLKLQINNQFSVFFYNIFAKYELKRRGIRMNIDTEYTLAQKSLDICIIS